MFDASAHTTSDALVAMLANELEQEQQAKGNALTAYCDREIAELHALIRAYPEETALWQRRIGQWQHIKAQQLGVSADDRLQAAYASLTK